MKGKIRWATDNELLNVWQGRKGIIIGRGENPDYVRCDEIAKFRGRKFGCNGAYKVYDDLDALLWLDHSFFRKHCIDLRHLECYLFSVNTSINENLPLRILRKRADGPICSCSFDQGFWTRNLTGFVALNVALVLGLDPLWLHGFISNYKRKVFMDRVDQFVVIADWCKDNSRTVYVADESSILRKFFKHRRLPVPKATQTRKGVMPYGMGQGRIVIDPVRLGNKLRGRPDDTSSLQASDKPVDAGRNTAGSNTGYNQGIQKPGKTFQGES